jgi:hypothetical protein
LAFEETTGGLGIGKEWPREEGEGTLAATTQFLRGVKTGGVQVSFRWIMAFDLTELGPAVTTPSPLTTQLPVDSHQSPQALLWALNSMPLFPI